MMCPLLLVAVALLQAQDLPRGVVIGEVKCERNPSQSYALYLPPNYTPDRSWPVLYCLDPIARGNLPVERFAQAAAKEGFIVVGSNNSRNGPMNVVSEAIDAMLADTQARFNIDRNRIYAAGFSGGSRVALGWAAGSQLAGVVACGAAFGSGTPRQVRFLIFEAAGIDDFNYHEMYAMSRALAKNGAPHRFAEFPGSHEWLPPDLAAQALAYFNRKLSAEAAPDSKEVRRLAERYQEASSQFHQANLAGKRSLIAQYKKDSARPNDSPERRVARQLLEGALILAIEESADQMEAKLYAAADGNREVAALLRPDAPGVWFLLAESRAALKERSGALDALQKAIELGFTNRAQIDGDEYFASLRGDPRFVQLLSRMAQPKPQ